MQAEGASVFFHGCCSVVGIACRQAGHLGPTSVTERRPVGNAAGAPTAAGGARSWQKDLAGHRERRRQAGKARPLRSVLAAVWAGCRRQLVV